MLFAFAFFVLGIHMFQQWGSGVLSGVYAVIAKVTV